MWLLQRTLITILKDLWKLCFFPAHLSEQLVSDFTTNLAPSFSFSRTPHSITFVSFRKLIPIRFSLGLGVIYGVPVTLMLDICLQ